MNSLSLTLRTASRGMMLLALFAVAGTVGCHSSAPNLSEEEMMQVYQEASTKGEHHDRLASFAGRWTTTTKMWSAPDTEPDISQGTSTKTLTMDGRLLREDFNGSFAGSPFNGLGLTGYDNVSEEYHATWYDSWGTGVTRSVGHVDKMGNIAFDATYNDPIVDGPKTMQMKLIHHSEDKHVLEMHDTAPDGRRFQSLEIVYERQQ